MFTHILRDQLEVTREEFWDCVSNGHAPRRGTIITSSSNPGLPLKLALELERLGQSAEAIGSLGIAEAEELLARLYQQDS